MRIISVNVGSVHQLGRVRGKPVFSGFVKKPVSGAVKVGSLNLEGDRQADLTVHGGVDKAVYAYASEHYRFWVAKYPDMEMPWGTFGENLTTEGLLESEVHVGDRLRVGSAEFEVTQPRFPCYKLGLRFGTQAILKTFLDSERSGYYKTTESPIRHRSRSGKNVFQLWNDNGRRVPLTVQKIGWDKNSWFVVTRVEVSQRQWDYFKQTGNIYGKAFGFFLRRGERPVDHKIAELRNSGVYKWRCDARSLEVESLSS